MVFFEEQIVGWPFLKSLTSAFDTNGNSETEWPEHF